MHQFALNVFAGFLAGLLCALGGSVKDAPYEGFKPHIFVRSPIVGTLAGVLSLTLTTDFFLAVAFSGCVERVVVEDENATRCHRVILRVVDPVSSRTQTPDCERARCPGLVIPWVYRSLISSLIDVSVQSPADRWLFWASKHLATQSLLFAARQGPLSRVLIVVAFILALVALLDIDTVLLPGRSVPILFALFIIAAGRSQPVLVTVFVCIAALRCGKLHRRTAAPGPLALIVCGARCRGILRHRLCDQEPGSSRTSRRSSVA
jgi:hypothetical protein